MTRKDESESRRLSREDRLRALGFEEPSEEQRREQLAQSIAHVCYEARSITSSAGTFEQRSEARIRRYERFAKEERRFLWWYTFLFAVYAVTTAVMVWGHL